VTPDQTSVILRGALAIQRIYAAPFQSDPGSIDLSDLGLTQTDHITATDPGGTDRNFGAVCSGPDGPSIFIHGTQTGPEWIADAYAIPIKCPDAPGTRVHEGFWELFKTFRLGSGAPLLPFLSAVGGWSVFGHSLGCPLATHLAARIGAKAIYNLAPPKPGDAAYCAWIRSLVPSITLLANPNDDVPKLPVTLLPPFNFEHETDLTIIGPGSIPSDAENSHIIPSYIALLQSLTGQT
jgi:pimeloyl-ACP methyl ester carboxylesterase